MLREVPQNEIFTILFVICIAILTVAKLLYAKRFNDFIWIISNSNYHKIYSRDLRFFDRFNILLFVNQLINIAIFVYIFFFSLGEKNSYGNTFIIELSIALVAFILFKFFLERIIGRVFDIPEIIDNYLFQKLN